MPFNMSGNGVANREWLGTGQQIMRRLLLALLLAVDLAVLVAISDELGAQEPAAKNNVTELFLLRRGGGRRRGYALVSQRCLGFRVRFFLAMQVIQKPLLDATYRKSWQN